MKLEQTYSDINAYGDKYHFYYHEENRAIVCTTLYKGQMVRGIAKCDPEDEFNLEAGKKFAYLRCKTKFARKKLRRALKARDVAFIAMNKASHHFEKAREFVEDSELSLNAVLDELKAFEEQLNGKRVIQ